MIAEISLHFDVGTAIVALLSAYTAYRTNSTHKIVNSTALKLADEKVADDAAAKAQAEELNKLKGKHGL